MAPLANTMALGVPKFARFSRLKASVRNCKLILSDTAVSLSSDKSTSANPGPVKVPRPRFPQVPAGGRMKAFALNHWVGFLSRTGPLNEGLREGRSGFLV